MMGLCCTGADEVDGNGDGDDGGCFFRLRKRKEGMDESDFGGALIVARELTGLGKCVRACVPAYIGS